MRHTHTHDPLHALTHTHLLYLRHGSVEGSVELTGRSREKEEEKCGFPSRLVSYSRVCVETKGSIYLFIHTAVGGAEQNFPERIAGLIYQTPVRDCTYLKCTRSSAGAMKFCSRLLG